MPPDAAEPLPDNGMYKPTPAALAADTTVPMGNSTIVPPTPQPVAPVANPVAPVGVPPVVTPQPQAFVPLPVAPDQTTTTRIEGGQKVTPEMAKIDVAVAESKSREAEAIAKSTQAQVAADQKTAVLEQQRAALQAKVQQDAAARQEAIRQATAEQLAKYQKVVADHEKDQGPPEDSVFTQLRQRFAIALGAFGAGLAGGPNAGLAAVEAERSQKINSWKAQYARRQGKVDDAKNLYAMFRQKGLDDVAATAAAETQIDKASASQIKAVLAGAKAPQTQEAGAKTLEGIQQAELLRLRQVAANAQGKASTSIETKVKAPSVEDQNHLEAGARDNTEIKKYKENREALDRFQDLRKAGADGAAMVDFIANALKQGSYDPAKFNAALKKRNLVGASTEKLREAWSGGVPPDILEAVGVGLGNAVVTSRQRAQKAIEQKQRQYKQSGLDPETVIGGETIGDAVGAAGATPSAYQGAH